MVTKSKVSFEIPLTDDQKKNISKDMKILFYQWKKEYSRKELTKEIESIIFKNMMKIMLNEFSA